MGQIIFIIPHLLQLVNGENNQITFDLLREDCAFSSKDVYIEIEIIVNPRAGGYAKNAGVGHIRQPSLDPIAFCTNHTLTISNGKEIQDFDFAPNISLKYTLITRSRGGDDLSTSFQRRITSHQQELTNTKRTKGNYQSRSYLKEVFGFAQHRKKLQVA